MPRIQYFLSSYPTLLELAVEATYPICEALTVSLISVSASVQGVTIMELDHYLAKPIPMNVTSRHSVRLSPQCIKVTLSARFSYEFNHIHEISISLYKFR